MYNVQNLVCEFAWVDVVTMRMVSDEGDVERADVWDEREALKEVMLINCQYRWLFQYQNMEDLPNLCSRLTPPILSNYSSVRS